MQLNIEEQIPIKTKIYKFDRVMIPATVKRALNWEVGDELELYATTKGIFVTKTQKKKRR